MLPRPFLKICGIRDEADAQVAIAAGANTLGFLIGLTHKAEDKVDEHIAARIIAMLPAHILPVMVTHLLDAREIAAKATIAGVRAIQVHDDLPPADMQQLRALLPGVPLIKAVHVMDGTALEKAALYAPVSDALLLDSRTKDRLGGTGLTHDWNISCCVVQGVQVPVILAGGLKPENVAEAVRAVAPAGIDANSGVENPDGSKSSDRCAGFIAGGIKALNINT